MQIEQARSKLIVALDGDYSLNQLKRQVDLLKNSVGLVKIGLRLFTRLGPESVAAVKSAGVDVFLDLKFHDIPNTVAHACDEAVRLGVAMFTVHAEGGAAMLARAVDSVRDCSQRAGVQPPKLLAVTVLTSLGKGDLTELGIEEDAATRVERLAGIAADNGVDGVIASPREIQVARRAMGEDFLIVTPGIRLSDSPINAFDDQRRTLSPGEAVRSGADYIVVGRPIIASEDPVEAATKIVQQMMEV